jgi:hypothetical protein
MLWVNIVGIILQYYGYNSVILWVTMGLIHLYHEPYHAWVTHLGSRFAEKYGRISLLGERIHPGQQVGHLCAELGPGVVPHTHVHDQHDA